MKINERNPKHWTYLARSGVYIMLSILARPLLRSGGTEIVVFYGHKLNGNLKALAEYCQRRNEYQVYFATLDPAYHWKLIDANSSVRCLSLLKLKDVLKIGQAKVIITDRSAPPLFYYLKLTSIFFIDVWHGIPFKGFASTNFNLMKTYEQVWVSSPSLRQIYIDKFGFDSAQVKVTGYARVDRFVSHTYSRKEIQVRYNIPHKRKIILIAPTWKHDDKDRKEAPFNVTSQYFFESLDKVAQKLDALIIFRAHLNAKDSFTIDSMENIRWMSHNQYPQSEDFLAIADLLVSDWSSIVFDYLPLHRPTMFLNVEPPFRSGFTVDKKYRFGELVNTIDELVSSIKLYGKRPEAFVQKYRRQIEEAEAFVYGKTLDGKSSERCYSYLKALMTSRR